ncbi:MAG: stage II sporulation protein R [Oscillospiraceae bacterium]|nr:stage II sporulation protein R [Oscillospiraceae bacterium]
MDDNRKLHPWELALLLSVCVTLLIGTWAGARQERLSAGVVRLHVIAASDSDLDQSEKLRVRDAVLAYLTPKLEGAKTSADARAILRAEQSGIRRAAESVTKQPVTVTLTNEHYPTRDYGSFALPAGTYASLRVILGAGAGHNWWCVVFPPLCTAESIEPETVETLSSDDVRLITADGADYVIKFRIIEWYDAIKEALT